MMLDVSLRHAGGGQRHRRTRRRPWRALSILVVLMAAPALLGEPVAAETAGKARAGPVLAPGWKPLSYPAPTPGTYELPPLGNAADGAVLDTSGRKRRLHEFLGDKVVVLSFVYMSCPDTNACPLATYVLTGIQRRALEQPSVGDRVRLVTLSFDPGHDTPEVMRMHTGHLVRDGFDWQFLTTDSEAALAPILRAYGQTVRKEYDEDGKPLGTISHILRVYLIDRDKRIRNIYSTSYLHADTLWSDIQTVAPPDGSAAHGGQDPAVAEIPDLQGPGDDKRGYESAGYETRSKDLTKREGRTTDLLRFVTTRRRGLPEPPLPPPSVLTPDSVKLGRKLFFDRRLSRNNTFSCAMCHVPEQGFTSNEMATAVGIEGRTVRRNAPTLYNVVFAAHLFHDGRESRLEQQIWGPLLAGNEMGNPAVGYVLDKLRQLPDYAGRFEAAFGGRGPTMETLGAALASYERTLVSANSPFDRWHYGEEEDALSPAARRGFELFHGKARCTSCHHVGEDAALFTDQGFHNTGIGYRAAATARAERLPVQVAPGVFLEVDPEVVADSAERRPSDLGRYEVTGRPEDRWKYKTPTLRNVALTAPYMHDGSLPTLRDVVEFYDVGGLKNELLDPLIMPLGLNDGEKDDLVAFLESLTGDNVDAIVADAFAVPVGDPGYRK